MNHKNKGFIFRLSEEEFSDLNAKVKMTRMERQNYMRKLIKGGKPQAAPSDELIEIIRAINKILINLHQIWCVAKKTKNPNSLNFKQNYERLQELNCDFTVPKVKWKI